MRVVSSCLLLLGLVYLYINSLPCFILPSFPFGLALALT